MVSVWVLDNNCSCLGCLHALEKEEALVHIRGDEFVIRIGLLNVMMVIIMMIIAMMVIVVTASECSNLS